MQTVLTMPVDRKKEKKKNCGVHSPSMRGRFRGVGDKKKTF